MNFKARQFQDTENYPTRFEQSRTRMNFEYIIILKKLNMDDGFKILLWIKFNRGERIGYY